MRELENACKRAALLAKSEQLTIDDFGLMAVANGGVAAQYDLVVEDHLNNRKQDTDDTQSIFEPDKQQIEEALTQHNGVIARVAKSFGLSRQALYRRMEKYGLRVTK